MPQSQRECLRNEAAPEPWGHPGAASGRGGNLHGIGARLPENGEYGKPAENRLRHQRRISSESSRPRHTMSRMLRGDRSELTGRVPHPSTPPPLSVLPESPGSDERSANRQKRLRGPPSLREVCRLKKADGRIGVRGLGGGQVGGRRNPLEPGLIPSHPLVSILPSEQPSVAHASLRATIPPRSTIVASSPAVSP